MLTWGTVTVGATVGKAASRVIGTLLGRGVAIVLASLTAGHTVAALAAILTRILLAFYLVKPSPLSLIVRMPAVGESYYAGTRCAACVHDAIANKAV